MRGLFIEQKSSNSHLFHKKTLRIATFLYEQHQTITFSCKIVILYFKKLWISLFSCKMFTFMYETSTNHYFLYQKVTNRYLTPPQKNDSQLFHNAFTLLFSSIFHDSTINDYIFCLSPLIVYSPLSCLLIA